jgi:DNA-binding beta-propeller fold protein YncE
MIEVHPFMTIAASTSTRWTALLLFALTPGCTRAAPQMSLDDPGSPLGLVRVIALPEVRGRIDHLAFDRAHDRLFVAEYGNGSVDEVDLATGTIAGRIAGLREPQGVIWLPKQEEIAVACGDGSLSFYRGADRRQVARIDLGEDADNLRLDPRNGNLVVGYGSGALAVVDPAAHRIVREVKLGAHPEGFAFVGSRVFVNVPDAHEIAVADLDQARVIRTFATGTLFGNFPMAVDSSGTRIAVAYRFPGTVSVMDAATGATLYSAPSCGDADDLYFTARRLVVVCGKGAVELIDQTGDHGSVRVATSRGARTGLLVPDQHALFVAVPAQGNGAAVWQLAFR